jgi:hypothetical protein
MMSERSKSTNATPASEFAGCGALSKPLFQQSEWWLKAQADLYPRLQEANARWLERRQRILDNGLAALRELAACRDLGEAAVVQQKWLAECLRSMVAEWTDLMSPFAEHTHTHAKRVKERTVTVQKVPEKAAA